MERYQGVKFAFTRIRGELTADARLPELNRWAWLFSQLGLTPVHADGAYGNQSCRTGSESFLITRAGMIPSKEPLTDNYCHVLGQDPVSGALRTEGIPAPSSESLLHLALYRARPELGAILHGHSELLIQQAEDLGIAVTPAFFPYGTPELAGSAVDMAGSGIGFFILRDHGFVALGGTIAGAGNLTLDYYAHLIRLLQQKEA